MNELKMCRVESDASNSPFQLFGWTVLPVANDRVSDRRKLNTDLILQSGNQRDSDKRSPPKAIFHEIAQLSPIRLRIPVGGYPLEHSFLPEMMNECPLVEAEMTANYREILAHRSVSDKLLNERFSIWPGFCKQQNPGREPIDAVYDIGPLPLRFQFFRKERQRGRKVGGVRRHRQHFRWFVEDHNGIVLVKDAKLPAILLS